MAIRNKKRIPEECSPSASEMWSVAKTKAGLFDPIPGVISHCIKTLLESRTKRVNSGVISTAIKPVDRLPTLKNAIYFGAATLFPNHVLAADEPTSKDLVNVLTPSLYAALLAVTYISRRSNKIAQLYKVSAPSEDEFLSYIELGYILGESIPALGAPDGAVLGAILQASLLTLRIGNEQKFESYRKSKQHFLSYDFEQKAFKCDRIHVAAHLVRMFGFSSASSFDISEALRGNIVNISHPTPALVAWAKVAPAIERIAAQKVTANTYSDLPIMEELQGPVREMCNKVLTSGSSFQWLKRNFSLPVNEEPELELEQEGA